MSPDTNAPQPSIRADDFQSMDSFIAARTALWNKVHRDLNPTNDVLPSLEAIWLREWMQAHAEIIGAKIRATAGLTLEELTRYASLGGLKQCVIELHSRTSDISTLKEQKTALEDTLRSIAQLRYTHAGRQTPEQIFDKIALIAHEALAYGRTAQVDAPAQPESDATTTPVVAPTEFPDGHADAVPTNTTTDAGGGEEPQAPKEPPHEQHAIPIAGTMQVFTAQKFMVMAGVRNLSSDDGEAYASNGKTYDATRKLDPQEPLPGGLSHVAWKEYAANL